ncbi:MAG TPA: DNA primase [Candidatus Absconditabacterales bacterium]|nr:DNA primase [Candidatus Absconditabacterales bacterium]
MGLTDDVLSRIDIIDVVGRFVSLKKMGSNYSGLCPFHNEKTPSFSVSQSKQIFKCFGCGVGGNALKFLMEIEKIDFPDALKILAKEAHVDLTTYQKKNPKTGKVIEYSWVDDAQQGDKEKLKYMNKLTQQFFVENLKKNSSAMSYLTDKRKLNLETIEFFGLGYAPDSHYELIGLLKGKGFSDEDILQSGLGKKSSSGELYSFLRNRIIFPLWDQNSHVVGFGARALDPNDNPKYLNLSDTVLYEKSHVLYGMNVAKNNVKNHDMLVIVEGYMDVIGLYRLGFPIGLATCGTALTQSHIKLCKRYTSNIFFLFDNDKAGFDATVRGLKLCYENDIFPLVLSLPDGIKDIDELANSSEEEQKKNFLSNPKDAIEAIFEHFLSLYRVDQPVEKNILLQKIFEILIHIQNFPILDHYLHLLAQKFGMYYELLFAQFQSFTKTHGKMVMKQVRQNDSTAQKIYQPAKPLLIASLLYENFYNNQTDSQDSFFSDFLKKIVQIDPQHPLAQVLDGSISDELAHELASYQLWWEEQLRSFSEIDKRKQAIAKIILDEVDLLFRQAMKQKGFSDQEKMALSKERQVLFK